MSAEVPAPNGRWGQPVEYNYEELATGQADAYAAPTYQWDGDEAGDLGPEDKVLEEELFGPANNRDTAGIDFSKIAMIELSQEGPERIVPVKSFAEANLQPALLKNLELSGIVDPTPIQKYCLPAILQGFDVIATAQTGSGKTQAYLVPIFNKLIGKFKKIAAPRPSPQELRDNPTMFARAEPLLVVIVPTRELAIQTFNVARKLCYRSMLRPSIVYGGSSTADQLRLLSHGCDILIGTPGRLLDFMDRPDRLSFRRVKYMVIDEADEMLHDDWSQEMAKILGGGEQEEGDVQYMLFSATFPKAVQELAKTHMAENHVRLYVGRAGSTTENIIQRVAAVENYQKRDTLVDLLETNAIARTIVFVNSKRLADELDDYLYNKGMPSTSMHSDRTQKEREDAMRAFRKGTAPILIATGVMARGIDVRGVMHVINYDLPSEQFGGIEEYTHRIGRTGRMGNKGLATSFYTERDEPLASVLVRTLLETKQEVPDFLTQYMPQGDDLVNLKFEAAGDFDGADNNAGGNGGGWGAGDDTAATATGGDAGWGAAGNDADANAGVDSWGAAAAAPSTGDDAWGAGTTATTSGGGW